MNLQPVKALKRQNLGLFEGGYKYQQPSPTTKKILFHRYSFFKKLNKKFRSILLQQPSN